MSARFGRNQRRLTRMRIAQLEGFHAYATERYRKAERDLAETKLALFEAGGGYWVLATGSEALHIPQSNVVRMSDTTERDEYGRYQREATIVVRQLDMTTELSDHIRERYGRGAYVSFRGVGWRVTEFIADQNTFDDGFGGGGRFISSMTITVRLQAVVTGKNPLEAWVQ